MMSASHSDILVRYVLLFPDIFIRSYSENLITLLLMLLHAIAS